MSFSTSVGGAQATGRMSHAPAGCLAAIAVPMSLLGLLGVFAALKGVAKSAPWSDIAGPAITGGIFTVVGFALLLFARHVFISGRKKAQLQQQHPAKPWMWREDWASGRIEDSSRNATVGLWGFAILWSAVAFPIAGVFFRQEGFPPRQAAMWLILLFPLVGLLLIWAAIRQTLARMKFGTSHLQLVTQPGVIGRQFRATLETNLKEVPADGMEVIISNIRRVTTGSGKSSSTSENVIWQETTTLSASRLSLGMNGVTVPLSFNIPLDAEPCDDSNSRNCVLWRVEVSAQLPGIDYSQNFEVPVFTTEATPVHEEEIEAIEERSRARVRATPVDTKRMVMEQSISSGTKFTFPPPMKGTAATAVAVLLALILGAAAVVYFDVVNCFTVGAGLICLLIGAAIIFATGHSSYVLVESGNVTARHRLLGMSWGRTFRADEVTDVVPVVGSSNSGSGKATYGIGVKTADGRSYTVSLFGMEKPEAEWIAEKIRVAIKGS
jgi:hypothetical protein